MARILALALAGIALPAFAQSTTTVTTQQQPATPPPPPPSTTTVTTQTPQPAPTTQVVVNPQDPGNVPPPTTTVRTEDESGIATAPSGRSAVAIIATDALYGGIAGALVGGGITLIDQGNNWARNLMIGGGVGILAGAGYGVYESATQSPPRRSYSELDPGASNVNGFAVTTPPRHF